MAEPNHVDDELPWFIYRYIIPATYALLPGKMTSVEATAMLLAIGLQESGFIARQQGGTWNHPGDGPAMSWWQFELNGGVKELLTNPTTKPILNPILALLGYPDHTPVAIHEAMEHNDVLACVMARLLLWIDSAPMPPRTNARAGWTIYLRNWRPGKPHPDEWPDNFDHAWRIITGA